MKKVKCIKNFVMDDGTCEATKGKFYSFPKFEDNFYEFINNSKIGHCMEESDMEEFFGIKRKCKCDDLIIMKYLRSQGSYCPHCGKKL
jgi:hypothetical protein